MKYIVDRVFIKYRLLKKDSLNTNHKQLEKILKLYNLPSKLVYDKPLPVDQELNINPLNEQCEVAAKGLLETRASSTEGRTVANVYIWVQTENQEL